MDLLNKIQQQLKAPKTHQKVGLTYKYRNAEDILEAVKPLLGATGTLVLSDDIVQIGDRFYMKATATLKDGKEVESSTAYAREELTKPGMDAAKITGATSSYARKYALNGLFCIDDTKDADDDEPAARAKPAAKSAPVKTAEKAWQKPMPTEQKKIIKGLCDADVNAVLVSKADYEKYVEEKTGLKLEEGNYTEIIVRLNTLSK